MRKRNDQPEEFAPIKSVEKVSSPELGAALFLIVAGVAPLAFLLYSYHSQLAETITATIIGTYTFAVFETFAIFLLWGFRRLSMPDKFVHWLGAATVGEVAGLVALILKYVLR